MRPLGDRARRSRARAAHRARYARYMGSPEWWERRRRWEAEHRQRAGTDPTCAICAKPWIERRDDMHHRTYDRLGREAHTDLIAMCRACHIDLHTILDGPGQWKRLDRRAATDILVNRLAHRRSLTHVTTATNRGLES